MIFGKDRVALGPVRAVDRVEPNASIADMDLQPIAIVLQLMRPTGATRRLRHDYGTAGMNESGRRVDRPATRVTRQHAADISEFRA
jgi:hypothetical protein